MFSGLSNAYLYTALQLTAHFDVDDTSTALSGTGFFVRSSDGSISLVTNRHVLDRGYGDTTGRFRSAKLTSIDVNGFLVQDADIHKKPTPQRVGTIVTPPSSVRFASNYFEDVACVRPMVLQGPGPNPTRIDYFVDAPLLADDQWIVDNLSVCDFVAFPGFPPWHDHLEGRPILRTGTIASDPRANYSDSKVDKGRRIAYEAFSFGGSSGSPIYATQRGFTAGPGITVTGYREAKLIGVNAGHLQGEFGAHSGISYFVRSSAVLELLR